jgi:mono/diheme cytochrome c family protein
MLGNLVFWLVLVAVAVLFGWLVKRAWGAKHWFVKFPGVFFAGLLMLVFALVAIVGGIGLINIYKSYPVAPVNITIANTPEQIARGKHVADMFCVGCHTLNGQLPLTGGKNMSDDTGMPLGDIYPPNITPGGKIKDLTDSDLFRILNTGVEPSGRVSFMNVVNARFMSDEDKKAVIAYLHSQPTVTEQRPSVNFSYMTAILNGAGLVNFDVPNTIALVTAPAKAPTKEYGEYITSFMDCHGCHGPTLTGDAKPPLPPGSNLTQIVPKWSKDDFFKAMRTGVDRDGHQINDVMPWKNVAKMDDEELTALYEYLHVLNPALPPAQ